MIEQSDEPTVNPPADNIADEFVSKIRAAWHRVAADFVGMGRLLIQAKEALGYGKFNSDVIARLPFDARTAERLIAIANHPILSDATHESNLPASWTTLYLLSRLSPYSVTAFMANGRICSGMERRDAEVLIREANSATIKSAPASDDN